MLAVHGTHVAHAAHKQKENQHLLWSPDSLSRREAHPNFKIWNPESLQSDGLCLGYVFAATDPFLVSCFPRSSLPFSERWYWPAASKQNWQTNPGSSMRRAKMKYREQNAHWRLRRIKRKTLFSNKCLSSKKNSLSPAEAKGKQFIVKGTLSEWTTRNQRTNVW